MQADQGCRPVQALRHARRLVQGHLAQSGHHPGDLGSQEAAQVGQAGGVQTLTLLVHVLGGKDAHHPHYSFGALRRSRYLKAGIHALCGSGKARLTKLACAIEMRTSWVVAGILMGRFPILAPQMQYDDRRGTHWGPLVRKEWRTRTPMLGLGRPRAGGHSKMLVSGALSDGQLATEATDLPKAQDNATLDIAQEGD